MKSFTPEYLHNLNVPHRLTRMLTAIAEFRGKQALWAQTKPEVLKALKKVAIIESVESSSRMENIKVGPQTFNRIVKQSEPPEPADRSQAELAGYRDALDLIHRNASDMPINEGVILQLHGLLMHYTAAGGGRYKAGPNDIVEKDEDGKIIRIRFRTVAPSVTPLAVRSLVDGWISASSAQEIEPLLLVPLFIHDFLCIHPFSDGNGRVARLLNVLMLQKLGYEVGRYVSIERHIERTKATYYDSLAASDVRWNEGTHDHVPFTEYILGIILAAYRELEERTAVDLDHGAKGRMVERAVEALPELFRLSDVEARCPLVGRDTVRGALAKLKREGRIDSVGRGRFAAWRRLQ